ncbi:hypothetical protein DSM3645_12846 [Blastopirellula marina DSM 3645]|uniref:Uncharacterized protein n=1 Tax=Blastopirellula marina DSM 3645 TaxID=314230 RepID=A3ZRY6_9BACT|nr:hypothetical protein DSM3645_12846 [Blastopirellula marina DSM 3645]
MTPGGKAIMLDQIAQQDWPLEIMIVEF